MGKTVEEVIAEVKPVKVKHLKEFTKKCAPVAQHLMDGKFMELLEDHYDELIDAVAMGADVDRAWLEEQGADTLATLAFQIVEVNMDFFVQTLLPRINTFADKIESVSLKVGGTNG